MKRDPLVGSAYIDDVARHSPCWRRREGVARPEAPAERSVFLSAVRGAARSAEGVAQLLELIRREMTVAMTLAGARCVTDINASILA